MGLLILVIGVIILWLVLEVWHWRRKYQALIKTQTTLQEELAACQLDLQTTKEKLVAYEAQAKSQVISSTKAYENELLKIEGIGPKVATLLSKQHITTVSQLAQTDVERLKGILAEAGPKFNLVNPASWPEQAQLIANDEWDKLKELQEKLKGGKY